MITETSIIRMFLYRHNLNAIIAILDYTRQNIESKLIIGSNLLCILGHADMTLVNKEWIGFRYKRFLFPFVRLFRIPDLGGENLRFFILNDATSPCRDTLSLATFPIDMHLIEVAMIYAVFRQFQLPIAGTFDALASILGTFLPFIKVTYQINVSSIGSPFAEHPAFFKFMQSVIFMSISKV